jgi:hypothetical protein
MISKQYLVSYRIFTPAQSVLPSRNRVPTVLFVASNALMSSLLALYGSRLIVSEVQRQREVVECIAERSPDIEQMIEC